MLRSDATVSSTKLRSRFSSLYKNCAETTKNQPWEAAGHFPRLRHHLRQHKVKRMKRGKSQPRRKEIPPASSVECGNANTGVVRDGGTNLRVGRQELGCRNCKTVENVEKASLTDYIRQCETRLRDNANFFSNEFCIQCGFEAKELCKLRDNFFPSPETNSCVTLA